MTRLWGGLAAMCLLSGCLELRDGAYSFPCTEEACRPQPDAGEPTEELPVSNAKTPVTLTHLYVSPGDLPFSPEQTRYTLRLLTGGNSVRLQPRVASPADTTLLINGQKAQSDQVFTVTLAQARGEMNIEVSREGFATTTYSLVYEKVDVCELEEDSCGDACCPKAKWVALSPLLEPPERDGHGLIFQAQRQAFLMLGGEMALTPVETWEWTVADRRWNSVAKATTPSQRQSTAMAYDASRKVVILFGGRKDLRAFDDTWEWSEANATWAKLNLTSAPSVRWGHAMTYDSKRSRILLFGGANASKEFNDTWEWNGTKWTPLSPSKAPSARYGHALAYDSVRDRFVLFGGSQRQDTLRDTWEWNGTTWNFLGNSLGPTPRDGHAMAFDETRARVILVGGYGQSDVWEWDGYAGAWYERPMNDAPSYRRNFAMAYNPIHKRFLVVGSVEISPLLNQVVKSCFELVFPPSPTQVSP